MRIRGRPWIHPNPWINARLRGSRWRLLGRRCGLRTQDHRNSGEDWQQQNYHEQKASHPLVFRVDVNHHIRFIDLHV